jgi:hypothetical protein
MKYSNDNYYLQENEDTQEYFVINKANGFIEYRTAVLIEALRMTYMLDFSLKNWDKQIEAMENPTDEDEDEGVFPEIDWDNVTVN